MNSPRRVFLVAVAAVGSALGNAARAQGPLPLVVETDPWAAGLGYVADASRADRAKFRNYVVGQMCSNCALYQGKPIDAAGLCRLYAAKQVAAKGWCSAYAKKA